MSTMTCDSGAHVAYLCHLARDEMLVGVGECQIRVEHCVSKLNANHWIKRTCQCTYYSTHASIKAVELFWGLTVVPAAAHSVTLMQRTSRLLVSFQYRGIRWENQRIAPEGMEILCYK